ncbi:MAG: type IV secretion system DNA-binding domain-containing protein [Bacteroidetes bacterium]|nr:type IV secretion system DNA-binding domain-containing protein [Bacteroidota bacterium]
MTPSHSELLTQRFYEWENRGRGWYISDEPVNIEPPYYPFYGHFVPTLPAIDDSKKPTWVSRLFDLFQKKETAKEYADYDIPPVIPEVITKDELIAAFSVSVPKDTKLSIDDMQCLLVMLSDSAHHISFEIHVDAKSIQFQFVSRVTDFQNIYAQVSAFFPELDIRETTNNLIEQIPDTDGIAVGEFGLADEFMFPLRSVSKSDTDPFIGLFALLEQIQSTESVLMQVLFKGVTYPWAESIVRAVSDNDGGAFFTNAPEILKEAREKVSSPLFAVCIRVATFAADENRAAELLIDTSIVIERITKSHNNRLFLLPNHDQTIEALLESVFHRKSRRLGMLLNSNELCTLVHFPTEDVKSTKLVQSLRKTKAIPDLAKGHALCLGINEHNGQKQLVTVPSSLRLRHTHIIGATGTGKSTLFLSMISQDIVCGNGLAVLDPHGDLIESILPYIPKERINDVILVDPADSEYPVAFNILSAHSEIEKDILSSDLVAAFKRLSSSWGDQMNSVLANAILAFLESKDGGTLIDLRKFLVEKAYRETHLKTVTDPHIVYYWQHEYPLLKNGSLGSILTRLDTFLRPKLIRNMVAQKKGVDFEAILDDKKILLIKLSQGLIGAENSYLLGTFFVSKIYQAAMARQAQSKKDRSDFFLYIDEFQNFITPSMSHILSGARKYHLGLILAHQDMQQLQKYDTELASSVVVNPGTRICFRLGDTDAKRFASGFSYFEAKDFESLQVGQAIARLEQPNYDFSLHTVPLPEVDIYEADLTAKLVIAKSREQYGTSKVEVEKSLEHLSKVVKEQMKELDEQNQAQSIKSEPVTEAFTPVEIQRQITPVKKSETQHRYLQTLIKKAAEARGYIATLEEVTPDGKGRVDVSVEKAGKKIACEVSVTTGEEWEAHNVEKCLTAGYDEVIVCSNDPKNLQRIREQLEKKLSNNQLLKVLTLEPDEVIEYFDRQIVQKSNIEKIVKGYRVKVDFDA